MYRAILPDGDIRCARYEQSESGVDLYTEDDTHLAFVPYANLVALIDDDVDRGDGRAVV